MIVRKGVNVVSFFGIRGRRVRRKDIFLLMLLGLYKFLRVNVFKLMILMFIY